MSTFRSNRPRIQNSLDILASKKPQRQTYRATIGGIIRSPSFLWLPGIDAADDSRDLISGNAGTWVDYTGTREQRGGENDGKGVFFPGDSSSGDRGSVLHWNLPVPLQSQNFTALVRLKPNGWGYNSTSGIFSGGYGGASDRTWMIAKSGGGAWQFNMYGSAGAYAYVNSSVTSVLDVPTTIVVRRQGLEITIWVNGVEDSDMATESMDTSSQNAHLGAYYINQTNSYATDGEIYIAAYWHDPIDKTECRDLSINPYLLLRRKDQLTYTPYSPGWEHPHTDKRLLNRRRLTLAAPTKGKPEYPSIPEGTLRPEFLWYPVQSNETQDLVSKTQGTWVVDSGAVAPGFDEKLGYATNFPGVSGSGNSGAHLEFVTDANLQQTDFTVLVSARSEDIDTGSSSGIVTGGYSATAANRSWALQQWTTGWRFYVYQTGAVPHYVLSSVTAAQDTTVNFVIRKHGTQLAIWVNGVMDTDTFAGTMQTSTVPFTIGELFDGGSNNYNWDGNIHVVSYWGDVLDDRMCHDLSMDPYRLFRDRGELRYAELTETTRILRRRRTQFDTDRNKPHRFVKLSSESTKPSAPTFVYCPGLRNNRIELISGRSGTFTTHSGSVTSQAVPIHGESVNFPGDATSGHRGAQLAWAFGTELQQPDFTALIVLRLETRGKSNVSGIFSGGYESAQSNRSWMLSHENSTKWRFTVYNDNPSLISIDATPDAVLDTVTTVIVRKRGTNIAIWANGIKNDADSFSGTFQQPGTDAKLGEYYWDGANNYPFDGDVFLAQYWPIPLTDWEVARMNEDPYLHIRPTPAFRYPYTAPEGKSWTEKVSRRPRTQEVIHLSDGRRPFATYPRVKASGTSPDFLWMADNNHIDMISGESAVDYEYDSWQVAYEEKKGRSLNFNADSGGGSTGGHKAWPTLGQRFQLENFTGMLLCRPEAVDHLAAIGAFCGGYDSLASNKSWGVGIQVSTGKWTFAVYNTSPTAFNVQTLEDATVGEMSVVFFRKTGAELAIWLNGSKNSNTTFTGTLQTSTDPVQIGGWYVGSNPNWGFDGDMWMAAIWKESLSDSRIAQISENPYSMFMPSRTNMVLPYTAPASGGYWGIDFYYRFIAGTR